MAAILDSFQKAVHQPRSTYVSEGDDDGDGDGAEKQDHAQRKEDALVGCDIDLQQARNVGLQFSSHFLLAAWLQSFVGFEAPVSPGSGSWRWWQKDTPELWFPDTGPLIWCCRSWRRRAWSELLCTIITRVEHNRCDRDLPGHEAHHEGHAQGLEDGRKKYHHRWAKEHVSHSVMFACWGILTKRTNKMIFQGNCLLLEMRRNLISRWVSMQHRASLNTSQRKATSGLRSRTARCRWRWTWDCQQSRK